MDAKKIKKYGLVTILGLLIFLTGFFSNRLVGSKLLGTSQIKQSWTECKNTHFKSSGFIFINPLLGCGNLDNISNQATDIIKEKINKFIVEQKAGGNVSDVAIYFRDLNNGPWFGIKEDEEFNPGSLLKVPKMMAVFKEVENGSLSLEKNILVKGAPSTFIQYFKPEVSLVFDRMYKVSELVNLMIVYSDNDAAAVIGQLLGENALHKTFEDLNIKAPLSGDYAVSIRSYSSFFRILFNSSYLNNKHSEEALKLLSITAFDKGLRAGVPASIQISHKFGERTSGNIRQLHNCGIVYYPDRPYILCVMTRGDNFDKLASVIAQISKIVYGGIDSAE